MTWGHAEPAKINPIDETRLINRLVPEKWRCPHCGHRQQKGPEADEILIEYGKYIEHCTNCGYLHIWYLKITEALKKQVVELLLTGGKA